MKYLLSIVAAILIIVAFFLSLNSTPAVASVDLPPAIVLPPSFLREGRCSTYYWQYKNSKLRKNDAARAFYYPQAVRMFEEAGFSEEKSRLYSELPTVESSWEPSAISPTQVKGFWQQTRSTASRYNLGFTNGLDDRVDFLKSTKAAIEHIKALEKLFNGDPVKVLFAYNGGEGEVIQGLKEHGTDNPFYVNFKRDEVFNFAPRVIGAYLYYSEGRDTIHW